MSKPPKYPSNNYSSSKKSDYDQHQDTSPKFASFETNNYFPSEKTGNVATSSGYKNKKNEDYQY